MTPTEAAIVAWLPYVKGQVEQRLIDAHPSQPLVSLMPEFRSFALETSSNREVWVMLFVGYPAEQPHEIVFKTPVKWADVIDQIFTQLEAGRVW